MKYIWVTDRHDMTLPVKVALNLETTNQPTLIRHTTIVESVEYDIY